MFDIDTQCITLAYLSFPGKPQVIGYISLLNNRDRATTGHLTVLLTTRNTPVTLIHSADKCLEMCANIGFINPAEHKHLLRGVVQKM